MSNLKELKSDRVESWEWVVLDIDGVLIDPSDSYDRAVKRTGELLLSEMETSETLDLDTIRSFRKIGRFGNDYKVTEGLVLAKLTGEFESFISNFPRGEDLNWIREQVGRTIGRNRVKTKFDQFYFGSDTSPDEPENDGLWRREEPLVDTSLLDVVKENFSFGYITGRSREEIELAEEILDYEIQNVVTRDEYQKPDPRALSSLVGDDSGVYIGDTYNDELLVENYNEQGNEFSFILIDENRRAEGVLESILEVSEL